MSVAGLLARLEVPTDEIIALYFLPVSADDTVRARVALVAPEISTYVVPPSDETCHWYVGVAAVEVLATVNDAEADPPAPIVAVP